MDNKNNKNDEMVLKLFKKVREKQKEISAVERPKWETSCTIGRNPDTVNDRINIQTVTDVSKLVDISAFLFEKVDYWCKAAAHLEVKVPLKWMGYEISLWQKDLKSRIQQININTKKSELQILEQRLNGLVSLEQRRELELAEIAESLKD